MLPLALVVAGISGVWLGSLRLPQPVSTAFALLSAASLAYYLYRWRRIGQQANACGTDTRASGRPGAASKLTFWFTAALTVLMLSSVAWAPLFY
jgi:MerT mercuric transport protein